MHRIVTGLASKISYANVTATLALVLAMAGGAGAASLIAGQGKNDSVKGCVKRSGVLTIPVSNPRDGKQAVCRSGERSLRLARAPITINGEALRGAPGPAGPKGDAGVPDTGTVAQARNGRIESATTLVPTDLTPHTVFTIAGIGRVVVSGNTSVSDIVLVSEADVAMSFTSSQGRVVKTFLPGDTGIIAGAAQGGTYNAIIERPATFGKLGTVVTLAIGNEPGSPGVPTKIVVQSVSTDLPAG